MKKISRIGLILIFLSFIIFNSLPFTNTKADSSQTVDISTELSSNTQIPKGKIIMDIYLTGNFSGMISSFKTNINYDSSSIKYNKITFLEPLTSGKTKTKESEGNMALIYLEDEKPLQIKQGERIHIMSVEFSVKEEANLGNADISAVFDDMVDYLCTGVSINNSKTERLNIIQYVPPSCALRFLKPSVGSLTPEFNPEVTSYFMDVDSSVDRVTFEALSVEETSNVTINRKTLLKQGETTEIIITVTAADKSNSLAYTVSVNRMLKEGSEASKSSAKTSTVSSSGKSSISSSTSGLSNTPKLALSSSTKTKQAVSSDNITGHNIKIKDNNFNIFLACMAIAGLLVAAAVILIKHKNTKS